MFLKLKFEKCNPKCSLLHHRIQYFHANYNPPSKTFHNRIGALIHNSNKMLSIDYKENHTLKTYKESEMNTYYLFTAGGLRRQQHTIV